MSWCYQVTGGVSSARASTAEGTVTRIGQVVTPTGVVATATRTGLGEIHTGAIATTGEIIAKLHLCFVFQNQV